VIGLEADGTIKGCPSLPTSPYGGGNIRTMSLEKLWRTSKPLAFNRTRTITDLWGFCRTCYYADICRGGCTWTTHVLFGKPGNNPYCHYRCLELAKRGLRERIRKTAPAPGRPFDFGQFELIVEPLDDSPQDAGITLRGGERTRLALPIVC
jgi:radical SAM protein with 4Fe4S-binding SPASM domain